MVEPGSRAGARARHGVADQARRGLRRGAVGDPDRRHPQLAGVVLARGDPVAELRRVEGDGDVGLDGGALRPRRSRRRRPEAMSAATTGAPQALIASIAASAGSRGAPSKPVPKIASTTAPEPSSAGGDLVRPRPPSAPPSEALEVRGGVAGELGGGPQQQRLDLVPGRGEQPRGDEPVAAVVALAADDAHRARPGDLPHRLGDRARRRPPSAPARARPRSSIAQASAARMPGGVVQGLEPALHAAERSPVGSGQRRAARTTAAAVSREW